MEEIDNAALLAFVNETIRPVSDRLAGLLPLPTAVLDAVGGKSLAAVLGTTDAELNRAEPWADADYAAVALKAIAGSGNDARTTLTNHHVIGILRVMAALKQMAAANPTLGPLVAAVAVNPRA